MCIRDRFVPSLKAPEAEAFLRDGLARVNPAAIVNATAFSARGADGATPLDATGCPVFQVALSTARRRDWAASERGLSPADLAMHVVLPEVDGRLFAGVVSFKSPGRRDPDLQFSRFAHRADPARVQAVVDRVCGWLRLAAASAPQRKLAVVLSTYPGRPAVSYTHLDVYKRQDLPFPAPVWTMIRPLSPAFPAMILSRAAFFLAILRAWRAFSSPEVSLADCGSVSGVSEGAMRGSFT